jgi:hypothetical protein
MDMLIRLTAMNAVAERNLTDQVSILSSMGFKPAEIASVLSRPTNVITATISYLSKRGKAKE